jgi:hypothetical protein
VGFDNTILYRSAPCRRGRRDREWTASERNVSTHQVSFRLVLPLSFLLRFEVSVAEAGPVNLPLGASSALGPIFGIFSGC